MASNSTTKSPRARLPRENSSLSGSGGNDRPVNAGTAFESIAAPSTPAVLNLGLASGASPPMPATNSLLESQIPVSPLPFNLEAMDISDAPPAIAWNGARQGRKETASWVGVMAGEESSPKPPSIHTPAAEYTEAMQPPQWRPHSRLAAEACSIRWGGAPAAAASPLAGTGANAGQQDREPLVGMPELLAWARGFKDTDADAEEMSRDPSPSDLRDGSIIQHILAHVFPAACSAPDESSKPYPGACWAAVDACMATIKMPANVVDWEGVSQGHEESAFVALGVLYFLSGLAVSHAFTTRLARTPDAAVLAYLASNEAVNSLRVGGGLGRSSMRRAEQQQAVTISQSPMQAGLPAFTAGTSAGAAAKMTDGSNHGAAGARGVEQQGAGEGEAGGTEKVVRGVEEREDWGEDWGEGGARGRGWEKRDEATTIREEYVRLKEQAMAARESERGEEASDWRVLRTQEHADRRNSAVLASMRHLSSELQRGRLEGETRVSDEALRAWSQIRTCFWELVAEEEIARGCIKRAIDCVDRHCAELGTVREELGDEVSTLRRKLGEAQARERESDRMWSLRAAGAMSELQSRCERAEAAEAAARSQVERLEGQVKEMQAGELAADEERFRGMAAKLRWAEEGQRKQANALVQHSQLAILHERLISQLSSGKASGTAELQAQVQACQQKVAASAADIRANDPPQVEDGHVVEEAIRKWKGQAQVALMCISSTTSALQANERETARLQSSLSGLKGELKRAREAVADMAKEVEGWKATSEALRDENKNLQAWAEGIEGRYRVIVRELIGQVADLRQATLSRVAWGVGGGGGSSSEAVSESLAEHLLQGNGTRTVATKTCSEIDPNSVWVTLDIDEGCPFFSLTRVREELRCAASALMSEAPERVAVASVAMSSVSMLVTVSGSDAGREAGLALAGLRGSGGSVWAVRCVHPASVGGGLAPLVAK